MTSELFRLKGTCYFLCVSLWNFLFLPLPAPGEIVLWLRICKADIPPSFPVIKKYLLLWQPEAVKWGLRVFGFVTKLYIFFSVSVSWKSMGKRKLIHSKLFILQTFPDRAVSIRKNSIPDSILAVLMCNLLILTCSWVHIKICFYSCVGECAGSMGCAGITMVKGSWYGCNFQEWLKPRAKEGFKRIWMLVWIL